MTPEDVADDAYCDQLEELIRRLGHCTTRDLIQSSRPTPVMENLVYMSRQQGHHAVIPMAPRWLAPYLHLLRSRGRVTVADGLWFTIREPTRVEATWEPSGITEDGPTGPGAGRE